MPDLPPANPPPGAPESRLLARVAGFYARTLAANRPGLDPLPDLRLTDPALLEAFGIGYCNGSLRDLLPHTGEILGQLQALGILDAHHHETLLDCVVVPFHDAAGNITGIYGRRAGAAKSRDIYVPESAHGLFNGQAARTHPRLILVEPVLDVLALWSAGFRNTIACRGANAWTEEARALFREHRVTVLYLVGYKAAGMSTEPGIPMHRVSWPAGMGSARDFFATHSAADFEVLLRSADPQADPFEVGQVELRPEGFVARYASRRYELCALDQPSPSRLRATIRALAEDPRDPRFVIDTLDLYALRSKRSFIAEAARLFGEPVEVIEADLNRLTQTAETLVARRTAGAVPAVELSDAERSAGAQLAHSPDLVGEIQRDLDELGIVGERTNRLLIYLAMTSRKMEEPLAVRIVASSGAGKSHLQAAVLSLCPPEDLIELTALTGRALFYEGEHTLRHKVIALAEAAGAAEARYALRNLISDRRLVIESTARNPLTGRLEARTSTVQGPAAVFETSTDPDTDAETRSRYVLLSVDESPEQTRAIVEAQRHSHTLDGCRRRRRRAEVLARQQAFQRMLRPVAVVNPFEPLLSCGDGAMNGTLPFRRDHPKYLRLILAVTFLHQHQRAVKTDAAFGEYVETTLEDIALAHELAADLFGQALDELAPPSRELLRLLGAYVAQRAGVEGKKQPQAVEWTRRELREAIRWTESRLRLHLAELVRLEYVAPLTGRRGSRFRYQLLIEPEQITANGRRNFVFKGVAQLCEEAGRAGLGANLAGTSQAPACEVEPPANPHECRANGQHAPNLAGSGGKHEGAERANAPRIIVSAEVPP